MPGKSKHGKGKHPHYKKNKIRQRQASLGAVTPSPAGAGLPQQATAGAPKPVTSAAVPPPPKGAARPATATIAHYPDIVSELKRIGILTGVIIVILIILSIVLS